MAGQSVSPQSGLRNLSSTSPPPPPPPLIFYFIFLLLWTNWENYILLLYMISLVPRPHAAFCHLQGESLGMRLGSDN